MGMNYFRAATKEEIQSSGVTVASLFFKNVFGVRAQRALSVFVALRLIFPYIPSDIIADIFVLSALG